MSDERVKKVLDRFNAEPYVQEWYQELSEYERQMEAYKEKLAFQKKKIPSWFWISLLFPLAILCMMYVLKVWPIPPGWGWLLIILYGVVCFHLIAPSGKPPKPVRPSRAGREHEFDELIARHGVKEVFGEDSSYSLEDTMPKDMFAPEWIHATSIILKGGLFRAFLGDSEICFQYMDTAYKQLPGFAGTVIYAKTDRYSFEKNQYGLTLIDRGKFTQKQNDRVVRCDDSPKYICEGAAYKTGQESFDQHYQIKGDKDQDISVIFSTFTQDTVRKSRIRRMQIMPNGHLSICMNSESLDHTPAVEFADKIERELQRLDTIRNTVQALLNTGYWDNRL